ncbi:MAG: iron ABC transporter permease [Nitrospirae bacterium]|nr:iron ABC transporter permease [Nitrospirota bacterium]
MIRVSLLVLAVIAISGMALFLMPVPINPFSASQMEKEILLYIRLPRVVTAFLMGMSLAGCGCILQALLRNPLADPYILGLSSGSALFATIGIMSGSAFLGGFTTPIFAFMGAILTGIIVGIMAWKRGGLWPERLLLAGIGVGFLFSSVLMLFMSISDAEALRRATLWLFGDLGMTDWSSIPYGMAFIGIGLFIAIRRGKALNTLLLGDDLSHSLGFSPRKETILLFTSVCLLTASSVSLGGMIGFIGLLMPHIMRAITGSDMRRLIPMAMLGGGGLLVTADMLGRTLLKPAEIPAGVITAILGAPYFLYLLRRRDVIG